ncbi:MAG: AmmeMemoRadiSam system protein B [Chlorobiaceae bacterium]|nr:AmmeMemoRadiSam system protein B [Chlorobiaceae bacterium]NTV60214.1 AmmeMemoRadiSam system protein B [Chlorobiaceae bacterium]
MNPNIRYPAVAETHYPSEAEALEELLSQLLSFDSGDPAHKGKSVRAILAPHAPYEMSGQVAADAYRTVKGKSFQTIFLLGDTHAFFFDGIATDSRHEWLTPLGAIPVNRSLTRKLCSSEHENIRMLDIAHDVDHVLELQLPFLQHSVEKGFSIVPILLGTNANNDQFADLLLNLLQPDSLVVVSTDLSHYPTCHQAMHIDSETIDAIVSLDLEKLDSRQKQLWDQSESASINMFCSPDAIKILLMIAKALGWKAERLSYSNSGHLPYDDKKEVVGYGSIVFYEENAL